MSTRVHREPSTDMGTGAQRGHRAPRFFTIADIADCVDVSTRSVRRWIASGELTAHRIGGIVRISEADFLTFLALRRGG